LTVTTVPLSEVASIVSGFAFKSDLFNDAGDGLPIVRIRDVTAGTSRTFYSGTFREEFVVNDGDALVGMDGEFNLGIWRGGRSLLNQRVCRIEAADNRLSQEYLVRFLPRALKDIEARTPFVTVKHLSAKELRAINLPLPPIPEQRRIAAILDKADALRAKRREAIAKLDQLLQSVFIDMFGEPATNLKGWAIGVISDLLESVKYGTSEKADLAGNVPILRMSNITYNGEVDLSDLKYLRAESVDDKYLVKPGDLLFNRTNSKELVGKTAVYEGPVPMAYAGYLVRARPRQAAGSTYISGFLNSAYGKATLRGMCKSIVGMANINAREFAAISIPLPPRSLQDNYASKVRSIKARRTALVHQQIALDGLFTSLQLRAFSGTL